MTRRDFLPSLAGGAAAAARVTPPNVLLILCDDLGYGDLGCYGHPKIQTPHLDRLASEGLRFTAMYAAAPVCSPSRAGLLTGRTPNRCGIYDWIPEKSPMHLRRSEITAARLLRDRGYATCHAGKWHLAGTLDGSQPTPGDHGFDHWSSTQNNALPSHENPVNYVRNGKPAGPLKGYSAALAADEAIAWLKRRDKSKPFLQMVWFHEPHEKIATAPEFVARYPGVSKEEAFYYGNVTQIDHACGRLFQALDEEGARENTLVLFLSDNGPRTGGAGVTGGLRERKLWLYEGGIREPGIVRWPGVVKPGTVSGEPVSFLDVLPTLAELAGAAPPKDRAIDGASIVPVLKGGVARRKAPLHWHYFNTQGRPKSALRDGDW